MNNKNAMIGILLAALLATSIWGQVESRKRKELELAAGSSSHQTRPAGKDLEKELKAEAVGKRAAAQLKEVGQEVAALRKRNAELEAKAAGDSKKASAAEQEGVAQLRQQIAQQQTVLEQQEQKLTNAAKVIEQEQRQAKKHEAAKAKLDEALTKLQNAEGRLAQLQKKQNTAAAEAESRRAQVIGLEKMVEERGAAYAAAAKELENCRLNSSILIAKIAEQSKQEQQGCLGAAEEKTADAAQVRNPVQQ